MSRDQEFTALFTAVHPGLVRTVWFVAGDDALARTVALDAFVELRRRWAKVLADGGRPDVWVRRTALSRAQREATRRQRRGDQRALEGVLAMTMPGPELRAAALLLLLMPPVRRAVVALTDVEGRLIEEVAELSDITVATASAHLERARAELTAVLPARPLGDALRQIADAVQVGGAEGPEVVRQRTRRARQRRGAGVLAGVAALAGASAVILAGLGGGTSGAARPSPPPAVTRAPPAAVPERVSLFRSPVYDYTITLPIGWSAAAASRALDDPQGTDATTSDLIRVPGSDTAIKIYATYLGSQTYLEWLHSVQSDLLSEGASRCGGDPALWLRVRVGAAAGYLVEECDWAEVFAPDGARAYEFVWSNGTSRGESHLPLAQFERLLSGVALPDPPTADQPLWPPSGRTVAGLSSRRRCRPCRGRTGSWPSRPSAGPPGGGDRA